MKTLKLIPAALLLCLAAACNKDDDNNNNNSNNLSAQDREFMMRSSYGNHNEIATGQIAAAQGDMAAVRSFGSMMVMDHTKAQTDLVAVGTQVGNTGLPTGPDSMHQHMAHMLQMMTGRAFDSAYMKMMVVDHQTTIDRMQQQISNGTNQRVKDYASSKLPTVQMHKRMADSVVSANGF